MTKRTQRTVFGEVADTYDEVRPTYPEKMIDQIIGIVDLGTRADVLDIGCGTGLLSGCFLDRGHRVLGIDPSPDMARVARRKFAGNPDFRLHLADFESWSPGPERFDLAVAGQSWHWLDSETRFLQTSAALRHRAHLALLWNAPVRQTGAVGEAIATAYLEHAPSLYAGARGSDPPPAGGHPGDDLANDPNFELLAELAVPWSQTYDAPSYERLMSTQSNHRLLDPDSHARLMTAIVAAINSAGGGTLDVRYTCRAYIGRAI